MESQNAILLGSCCCIASLSPGILPNRATLGDYLGTEEMQGYPFHCVEDTTTNSLYLVNSLIEKALDDLDALSKLPTGWDSYGSPTISTDIIMAGKSFLSRLHEESIPSPHVVPISGGGIQLEWQMDNRELELEFIDSNTINFLKVIDDQPIEEDQFHFNDLNTCHKIIRWLKGY